MQSDDQTRVIFSLGHIQASWQLYHSTNIEMSTQDLMWKSQRSCVDTHLSEVELFHKQFLAIFRRHKNLSYIEKRYRLYEVSTAGRGIIFRPFIRPFDASWLIHGILSFQIIRCCRKFRTSFSSRIPDDHPSRQSRKNCWIIYVFFSPESAVAAQDANASSFCRPFECLMPDPQNSPLFSIHPVNHILLTYPSWPASRGETRPDVQE